MTVFRFPKRAMASFEFEMAMRDMRKGQIASTGRTAEERAEWVERQMRDAMEAADRRRNSLGNQHKRS